MTTLRRTLLCVFWQSQFRLVLRHKLVGHCKYSTNGNLQKLSCGVKCPWVGVQACSSASYRMCQSSAVVMAKHKEKKITESEEKEREGRDRSKRKKKQKEKRRRHSRSPSSKSKGHKHSKRRKKKRPKEKHKSDEVRKAKVYAKMLLKIRAALTSVGTSGVRVPSSEGGESEIEVVYDSRKENVSRRKRLKNIFNRKNRGKDKMIEEICLEEDVCEIAVEGRVVRDEPSTPDDERCNTPERCCPVSEAASTHGETAECRSIALPSTSTSADGCASKDAESSSQLQGALLLHDSSKNKRIPSRWEAVNVANVEDMTKDPDNSDLYLMFDVLSYNVLSQEIMEDHMYLYNRNSTSALNWEYRSQLLMKEFEEFNADILCLQEVQQSHLKSFYSQLNNKGYSGLYKQRTGNKADGVAIYYKNATFQLIDYATVEYYQPRVPILNRDNVAIVAKFAPKKKPMQRLVVATTHLLFNPNRHDVKLAQIQLLLAEVERFAFRESDPSTGSSVYWPVIITGDMNFEPNSGEFKFLTEGWLKYQGLGNKKLTPYYGRPLSKNLIPPSLGITDTCQHWNILLHRNIPVPYLCERGSEDHVAERSLIQLYNSDHKKLEVPHNHILNPYKCQYTCTNDLPDIGFGTGQLSHRLNLTSVYVHDPDDIARSQVSTFQDEWVVVDYMFYSQPLQVESPPPSSSLKLIGRYKMLTALEAQTVGPIPNSVNPSDHYPLAAKFALIL